MKSSDRAAACYERVLDFAPGHPEGMRYLVEYFTQHEQWDHLVALYDDGDDSWAEPRAPYPHARVVAALRSSMQSCALLFVGYARSAETQAMVERGWLTSIQAPAAARRELCPVVRCSDDANPIARRDPAAHSRLPHGVFTTIRAALAAGPVLVQVPRAGYLAALACARCRTIAHCANCDHPLVGERAAQGATPVCRVCGLRPDWQCPECGSTELRAPKSSSKWT